MTDAVVRRRSARGRPAVGELGARPLGHGRCSFRVWAPDRERVDLLLLEPAERTLAMERDELGYHAVVAEDVAPGARYLYRLDGDVERPDPASRWQPDGVHGPSAVVEVPDGGRLGSWAGVPLADCVFYEVHVGTFTAGGTFESAIGQLDRLVELGVTVVELMPVAQVPGTRNWGYDGVDLFAVQESYGGPPGLAAFVDACHERGLGVCLDVVYNHLGPEGNYLRDFGPYFTDAYHTPWGEAVNLDGPGSDEVRRFLIANAHMWLRDYGVDVLRLDAVHAFIDRSARPFLRQLAEETAQLAADLGRELHLIAESDLNDSRLIRPRDEGGFGLDAQWADDFHHAMHARLTGETRGYYADYGDLASIGRALCDGYAFTGQRSDYRGRTHGNDPGGVPSERFVVAIQNHDQVGNRLEGDRLNTTVTPAAFRAAATTNLLAPFLPLLFMGEEYGEQAPFPYFTSHSDPELVEAVREGRKREFSSFDWGGEPPDPQAESTFRSAILDPSQAERPGHAGLLALYRAALRLRRERPGIAGARAVHRKIETLGPEETLLLRRSGDDGAASLLALRLATGDEAARVRLPGTGWRVALDSNDVAWGGEGAARLEKGTIELAPRHAVLLVHEDEEAMEGNRNGGAAV